MIIDGNKITPEEGKWLYNGEVCSDLVYLGKNASADEWQEVDEYIEPSTEQPIPDSEALSEDISYDELIEALAQAEYELCLWELGIHDDFEMEEI